MSHELRTPLNAIIGFAELLQDGRVSGFPERQRATFLRHIEHGGRHLLGLINQILDISKVEAGLTELHFESVSLRSLVDDCVETTQPVATRKQISLDARTGPVNAEIIVDPVRLKQVLYNLVSNAVKFTPEGAV